MARRLRPRLWNLGTLAGLVAGTALPLLLAVSVDRWEPGAMSAYVVLPFLVTFPPLRLLPLRGISSLGVVVFALVPLYLLAWFGGLGVALALVLATTIPDDLTRARGR